MSNGGRIYTNRITMNPPADLGGGGFVNFYAVDADPNGELSATLGDRAWQIGSTNKWVCNGGTSWSLDDGGAAGAGWDVILRPAGPADPEARVYTTFADAYAAAIAIDGEVTLWIDTDGVTPYAVEAGTYDLQNITLKGWVYPNSVTLGGQHFLFTGEGCVFENFINGVENISLGHLGSDPLCTLTPTGGLLLRVRNGKWSNVASTTAAVWRFESIGGPSTVIFEAEPYSILGGATAAVIDAQSNVAVMLFGDLCSLQDDFFSGVVTSTLNYGDGLYEPAAVLTGMLGIVNGANTAAVVAYEPGQDASWSGVVPTNVAAALDSLASGEVGFYANASVATGAIVPTLGGSGLTLSGLCESVTLVQFTWSIGGGTYGPVNQQLTDSALNSEAYFYEPNGAFAVQGQPLYVDVFSLDDWSALRFFSGWIGALGPAILSSDNPVTMQAGLQFSTARGDTEFQIALRGTAGGQTLVPTGIVPVANAVYKFVADLTASRGVFSLYLVADGGAMQNTLLFRTTVGLPAVSTLRYLSGVRTLDANPKGIYRCQTFIGGARYTLVG